MPARLIRQAGLGAHGRGAQLGILEYRALAKELMTSFFFFFSLLKDNYPLFPPGALADWQERDSHDFPMIGTEGIQGMHL